MSPIEQQDGHAIQIGLMGDVMIGRLVNERMDAVPIV
jgi:hypothetical protein